MKYIIDFENEATQEQINAWLATNEITVFTKTTSIGLIYVVECDAQPQASAIVSNIIADVDISSQLLQTEEVIALSNGPTGEFDNTNDWWKAAVIRTPDFNSETTTFEKRGSKSTVYVVDSGISSHADFTGIDIQNLYSFTDSFGDTTGHGTAIASIVAGVQRGITVSRIQNVKIFDSTHDTMLSDIVAAIDAIHADIMANLDRISIVNLSWSIPKNDYVEQKLQSLIEVGAIIVVAAGNSGMPIGNVTPASMPSVLTIGAFTEDFTPADFSNYTSAVSNTENETNFGALDGWAPGVNIGVATLNGEFGLASGTSMSAAIVSAALAYNSGLVTTLDRNIVNFAAGLTKMTFSRLHLLHLSTPYTGSVNQIVTALNEVPSETKSGMFTITHIISATKPNDVIVVYNMFVTKIELDAELPEGLSLSNGWIVGNPVTPPEQVENLHYNVTITFDDGTITTVPMTLAMHPVFATPDDEKVAIEATVLCGGTATPQANCYGQCGQFVNCGWRGKAGGGCLC